MLGATVEQIRNELKKLRTRGGLTRLRLSESQLSVGDLLDSPAVRDRIEETGESPSEALIQAVRTLVGRLEPTERLTLDAALSLRVTLAEGEQDFDALYGPDLTHRRNALLRNWTSLHRRAKAVEIPRQPSATLLRTRLEDEAFLALARRLLVGDAGREAAALPRDQSRGRAFVFGSAVTDHLYRIPKPFGRAPGSVQATSHVAQPGGKGLTQAVALARLDFDVELITVIGDDLAADEIMRFLAQQGVRTTYLTRVKGDTPHVNVVTDDITGQSFSIAWPNTEEIALRGRTVAQICKDLTPEDLMFVTFEIPFGAMREALQAISFNRDERPTTFVTPSPPATHPILESNVFARVDYLIARHWELRALVPDPALDAEDLQVNFLRQTFGVRNVVVCGTTKAHLYSELGDDDWSATKVSSYRESAGSREAFAAAMAALLAKTSADGGGKPITIDNDGLRFATAAMAISAMQPGIATGLPRFNEIDAYVKRTTMGLDHHGKE